MVSFSILDAILQKDENECCRSHKSLNDAFNEVSKDKLSSKDRSRNQALSKVPMLVGREVPKRFFASKDALESAGAATVLEEAIDR